MSEKSRSVLVNFIIFSVIISIFTVAFLPSTDSFAQTTPSGYAPIYRGNTQKKQVALMINVYWGTEFILPILDVLSSYDAKATFFIGGCWADKNGETLKAISDAGFEIGNHGFFHIDHKKATKDKNEEEIRVAERLIEATCGARTTLFAPPSGSFSKTTLSVAEALGYKTVMWSKDTVDWRDADAELCFSRATKNLAFGDLILMHPTKHTLEALPRILDYYKNNGFSAVTVSECISDSTDNVELPAG